MYYIVSGIVDIVCAVFAFIWPLSTPALILIKIFSIPVTAYLFFALAAGEKSFFYLNLGFSRNEYRYIPVAVDALVFMLLLIIALSLSHVFIAAQ